MTVLKSKQKIEYDLVLRCLDGESKAYKQLFDHFAPTMMSICIRYAEHKQEAEDILQDGFILAFQKLSTFRFDGSFEGWLRRLFVNSALQALKKKKRQISLDNIDNYVDLEVDNQIFSALSEQELLHLLLELPLGYRRVFNMYVIEGFSHKEIAEELNINESTSRSQLVKAKRALKALYLKISKTAV